MTARAEQGFTLLEMLVALAVLSLGALALLNLAGESTRQATASEDRFFAGVVAENAAIEALTAPVSPALGESGGAATLAGQDWRWTQTVARTTDPAVLRIDVRVSPRGGRTASEVTVFRGGP